MGTDFDPSSNGLMESIFQSITDGVIVADREGRFVFFNNAAQSILGLGAISTNPDDWPRIYGCYLSDKVTPYPPEQTAAGPRPARRARL